MAHLRCGFFFTNLLLQLDAVRAGTIYVVLPVDQPMPWVAPRDIADVAVGRLLNPDWSGRVRAGRARPGGLDLAAGRRRGLRRRGRRVRVKRVSDDRMREDLARAGMGPGPIDAIMGMSTGLRDGFVPEQPRTPQTSTPTTLTAWCHDELLPAL